MSENIRTPKLIRLLIAGFIVALLMASPILLIEAKAVTCYHESCNNTNPHSTGCDVGAITTNSLTNGCTKVELRKSTISDCGTWWARTTNKSITLWLYANATLKYHYFVCSPGTIAPGYKVYTNQKYGSGGFSACGLVSSSGPICTMYYSNCVP